MTDNATGKANARRVAEAVRGEAVATTMGHLDRIFLLEVGQRKRLAEAVLTGKVAFSLAEIQLPPGVSQSRINGYRRDLNDFGPEGIVRLKERLAGAEERQNEKLAATLQRKIDNAPTRYDKAEEELADALALQEQREQALHQWLKGCSLGVAEIRELVVCLRHNVTYIHFLSQSGVLYSEPG